MKVLFSRAYMGIVSCPELLMHPYWLMINNLALETKIGKQNVYVTIMLQNLYHWKTLSLFYLNFWRRQHRI